MVFLSPERLGSPVFTANLFGSGTSRLLLLQGDPGILNFGDLTYTFDAQTPVPEPATLTLIGSGIAGLVLRSRRRRRAQAM